MKHPRLSCLFAAALCAAAAQVRADTAIAVNDIPVTLGFSGFIRADYGSGDRYPKSDGEDRLGISKSFLVLTADTEDVRAILDFGASALTDTDVNPSDDGRVGIKDAFIIVGAGHATGFSFSAGAQPLLFGLKPNGYPGDSSLTPNIDYGAAGGFAVSQQAGPSIIGNYKFTPDESLRFGAFDLVASNALNGFTTASKGSNGSKLKDNLFLLWRGGNLGASGIYATAGAERLYVGTANGQVVDTAKSIFSAGVGFKQGIVDASVEYIHLDKTIVNTASDEHYIRAAITVQPATDWTAYADYSNGHELGASTYRIGGSWQFRRHLALTLEYSKDQYKSSNEVYTSGNPPPLGVGTVFGAIVPTNVESVDARLTFVF
jgi:hypothetical protein